MNGYFKKQIEALRQRHESGSIFGQPPQSLQSALPRLGEQRLSRLGQKTDVWLWWNDYFFHQRRNW